MSTYARFIVGLDLSQDCFDILEKAQDLANTVCAEVIVCHVIEPIHYAYGGDIPINLAEAQLTIKEYAQHRLDEILQKSDLSLHGQHIVVGDTAQELRKLAAEHEADLIVVGSHGRHGLALLMGSTASGVIHAAECDVLAIRV